MTAQKLAAAYRRNGGVITNVDGTTRLMSRSEIAKARRFTRRTPRRIAWYMEQKAARERAARNLSAMLTVAQASGLAA